MTKIIIFVEYFLINQKGKLNNKKKPDFANPVFIYFKKERYALSARRFSFSILLASSSSSALAE